MFHNQITFRFEVLENAPHSSPLAPRCTYALLSLRIGKPLRSNMSLVFVWDLSSLSHVILPFCGHLSCWTSPPSSAPIASPSPSSSAFFLLVFLTPVFFSILITAAVHRLFVGNRALPLINLR
ncbi:hypothetical protein E2C01_057240 [Portunus trituberculatus]|uniref:Uncharacterized protein n=1 Tax=Portunus trituberculatus TaxID=210409 RepID=A0A5B7H0I8_PORTR|nr:hypothetical protein [Portunus trituberculatus]